MNFIMNNYEMVLIGLVLLGGLIVAFTDLFNMSKTNRLKKIKRFAYTLVTSAESAFGSGKGKQKFEWVYGALIKKFPSLRFVPSGLVAKIIEKSLDELKEQLGEEENNNDGI